MVAMRSLWKWPLKMPNLKPLSLFSPLLEHVKRFLSKSIVLKIDLYIVPSNILFAGVSVWTFQPGKCTGWGSEGAMYAPSWWYLYTLRVWPSVNTDLCLWKQCCPIFSVREVRWEVKKWPKLTRKRHFMRRHLHISILGVSVLCSAY